MSSDASDPDLARLRSCLSELCERLDELGTPWAIAGAFAADEYRGSHRVTTDGDLLVEWHPDLPAVLERAGFELRIMRDQGEVHLIRANRPDCGIDLIVGGTEYQSLAIRRANRGPLTIEDVLIHKALAWRTKDRDDIKSILAAGQEFDREYVDLWTREWGVEERWREALTWI
jgi:hypothetical protein